MTAVASAYLGLAALLAETDAWDAQSLCDKWAVRHVVAHVTMPVRLTPESYGAEMAAAGGDFSVLSNTVAARDGSLPVETLLGSPVLHAWEPPGGKAAGALSHAVIHSLDITIALGRPAVAPVDAMIAVIDQLVAADGRIFGIDLTGVRLEATDTGRTWGQGRLVRASTDLLVAYVSGRKVTRRPA
jgi:uncharacterized protein (TIGR03083 family)